MIKPKFIKENIELVKTALVKRGLDGALVDNILELNERRVKLIQERDSAIQEHKATSEEMGQLFKEGKPAEANTLKDIAFYLKTGVNALVDKVNDCEKELNDKLLQIPNIVDDRVPVGKDESDNIYIDTPDVEHNEDLLPHWEVAEKTGIIDFKRGVKLTGAGFPVYVGQGAKLQRALIQFFMDKAEEGGYQEVQVPHLVNEASGYGTGQLPDKDGQMYHATEDDLYLIPTAEVPVTNLYRDEIIKDFPIKNFAYSPCFRREAGSYGSDVKGLNRLHQFDKVEIVQITKPEDSEVAYQEMLGHVEGLLKDLKLPYRKVLLCTGDLGFTSHITTDFEVYSPAQDKWLEVSSVSKFADFQANRLNLRYKEDRKTINCHTLNGSALALPRIMATILENFQVDGKIEIPEVLWDYTKFREILL